MARPLPISKWIRARKDGRYVVDSRRVVCFWRDRPCDERVDVTVDGGLQPRPDSPFA